MVEQEYSKEYHCREWRLLESFVGTLSLRQDVFGERSEVSRRKRRQKENAKRQGGKRSPERKYKEGGETRWKEKIKKKVVGEGWR
jgi:hypothetical protein